MLSILIISFSYAQTYNIEGNWYNEEKDAIIKIYKETNGTFSGKIKWMKFPNDEDGNPKTDPLNPDKNFPWPCEIVFYKQFNIPFKYRFSKCYWKRDKKREKKLFNKLVGNSKNYAFVHDDKDRNFFIDSKNINPKLKIIKNDNKKLIFDFVYILEHAKEIHIMESSFRQIVEVLDTKNKKLYLYKGRGGEHSIDLYNTKKKKWIGTSKKWRIIKRDIDLNKQKKNKTSFIKYLISRLDQKIIYHLSTDN